MDRSLRSMALDTKSFLLGVGFAYVLGYFGPWGFYAGVTLLIVGVVAWIGGGIRESRSVRSSENCARCGAPNPPESEECGYCGEPLGDRSG